MNQIELDLQPSQPEYRTKRLRGASWNKRIQKWEAFICFDGTKRHIAFFDTPEEAHEAYKAAGGAERLKAETELAEYAKRLEATLDSSIRVIPLTQGQVTLVDAADYDRLNQWKWFAWWSPDTKSFYAARNSVKNGKRIQIKMHRELMEAPDGLDVDHIHHATLNNCRTQLRLAGRDQNIHNSRMKSSNSSGYRGVNWSSEHGKWRARIHINGNRKHLGYFDDPKTASEVYETAAREAHGEFYCAPIRSSTASRLLPEAIA